jgi:hypothetical protein
VIEASRMSRIATTARTASPFGFVVVCAMLERAFWYRLTSRAKSDRRPRA